MACAGTIMKQVHCAAQGHMSHLGCGFLKGGGSKLGNVPSLGSREAFDHDVDDLVTPFLMETPHSGTLYA